MRTSDLSRCHLQLRETADKHALPVHMDGARVMNAAIALNVPIREILQYVDTVNMCFSKVDIIFLSLVMFCVD